MTFGVEFTAQAAQDAEDILSWLISQHAGELGLQWFIALEDAIASLAAFPKRCPLAPENSCFPFEVRHLFYGRKPHAYRVLFTIEENTVYVLHIRHGRRRVIGEP